MAVLGQADRSAGTAVVERVDRGRGNAARTPGPRRDGDGDGPARPRLAHQPALDGLRGLAVLAVLLFHLERLDGGFLGVDLFFVLSGFLITSLLAVEHRARGVVDLGRFWARRARRLLPALVVLLVGVSVLLLTLTPADQRGRFRGEALATLGYVANWHRMSIDLGYWDIFEQPSPLDHTWSLAIEEQFYVVWPLVAVAVLGTGIRLRRRLGRGPHAPLGGHGNGAEEKGVDAEAMDEGHAETVDAAGTDDRVQDAATDRARRQRLLGGVALAGAAVSFGLLAVAYSPVETDRAYYGTDTRIGATLLGAALALLVSRQPVPPRVRRPDDAAGGVAAVPGGATSVAGDPGTPLAAAAAPHATVAATAFVVPGDGDAARGTPSIHSSRLASKVGDRPASPSPRRTLRDGGGLTRASWQGWPVGRWAIEGAGALGLAWMVWSVVTVDGLSPWYYRGGLLLFAVAALVVIQAVTATGGAPGPLARVVGWAPLRGLGVISYGVYLWHWPVDVYLTPERAGFGGWALDGLRLAVTLAVALASYHLVEQPIRRGALPGRALWFTGAGAFAVTLAAILVATAGAPGTVGADVDATDDPALGFGPVPVEGSDNPYLLYPTEIPPDATRVLLVGDSGAYHLGPILAEEGAEAGFTVASSAPYWCNIALPEGLLRFDDGEIMDRGDCQDERRRVLRDLVDELRPHAVVYYLANASGPGEIMVDGEWTMDCEEAYDRYLTRALQADVDLLSARGARVVLATSPYTAVLDELADDRTDCRNATFRRVADSRPGQAAVVDMNAFVAGQGDTGVEMFMDLVHLSPEGSRRVSGWLLPQLRTLAGSPR